MVKIRTTVLSRRAAWSGVGALCLGAVLNAGCTPSRSSSTSKPDTIQTKQEGAKVVEQPSEAYEKKDLAYGPDPAQRLDVYVPASAKGAPLLFLVHGGAWRLGDKSADGVVEKKVRNWRGKGYIVISSNYRLRGANPIDQARDVALALSHVQKNATSWGGDPTKLVAMGHSAGAHLLSLLASDFELARAEGCQPWLATIALDSAAYDVEAIMKSSHMRFYDRVFGEDPAFWRQASPSHRLTKLNAPFLAVCSTERSDSCPQAENFVRMAQKTGGEAKLVRVAMSHRDINHELGEPSDYTEEVASFIRARGLP